jgi:hypothetical protein
MRRFCKRFLAWLTGLSLVISAATAIYVYWAASGSDAAMMGWRFLSVYTKWQLVDLHTVFGLFALLTGIAWFLLRKIPGSQPRSAWARLPWAAALATVIVVYGAIRVLDGHPVLIEPPRLTEFVATVQPDKIVLTMSGDPATTKSVQWRTSTRQKTGAVRYKVRGGSEWQVVKARTARLDDPYLINDPYVERHTARLEGLSPDTSYVYQVGHDAVWSTGGSFRTAPAPDAGFRFIYMGDPQNGLASWGELLRASAQRHPETAFYAIAGDLVDGGDYRDEWDVFFAQSAGVLDRIPLLPAVGNHETSAWRGPQMYLEKFDLPRNGSEALTPERSYFIDYGSARFIVLDTESSIAAQTEWLERTLAENDRPWTIAMYHHPAFSSRPDRDNPEIREHWKPLFDEYGVDLALQGHDHAYLRTQPMRAGVPVASTDDGTTYIVAVSGTKYYDQAVPPFAAAAFTAVSTYQVIDVRPTRLTYTAHTLDGSVVDAFHIDKSPVQTTAE